MGKIHILDKSVSDMIAAGEVVERPLSIVKELVENSIDAGATTITVTIADGGISLIRVADNGLGMSEEDARLCFMRHATSKIKTGADLDAIYTLGFRGEALSSIGAVSKARIYTKRRENTDGISVSCEGGVITSSKNAGTPNGTIVEVRDLFFNTPARKKFLKKPQTEGAYVGDIIERYTLSYPKISFKLIRDGKEVIFSSGDNQLKNAIYSVYGKDYAKKMINVDYEADGIRITGAIGPGTVSRPNRSYQSYFVNNRYIKSVLITRAVEEAYKNQVMIGKFPMAVLNIEILPSLVDINVHPTKLECKFSDDEIIYKAVYKAVRDALYAIPNVPEVVRPTKLERNKADDNFLKLGGEQIKWQSAPEREVRKAPVIAPSEPAEMKEIPEPITDYRPSAPAPNSPERKLVDAPIHWAEVDKNNNPVYFRIIPVEPPLVSYEGMSEQEKLAWDRKNKKYFNPDGSPKRTFTDLYCATYKEIYNKLQEARIFNYPIKLWGYNKDMDIRSDEYKCFIHSINFLAEHTGLIVTREAEINLATVRMKALELMDTITVCDNEESKNPFEGEFSIIGQLFNTYILVEKDETMLIIDQHAAHERLNFEALKEEMKTSGVTSQMSMLPVEFQMTENELHTAADNRELLNKMGFEFEISGNSVAISSMPAGVSWSDCEDLFSELIEEISDNRQDIIDVKRERMLYSISCKASIKANMSVSYKEMESLAKKVFALDNINSCPHGRPIVISMTKKELEKEFKRIV